jgi:hypothetical protein
MCPCRLLHCTYRTAVLRQNRLVIWSRRMSYHKGVCLAKAFQITLSWKRASIFLGSSIARDPEGDFEVVLACQRQSGRLAACP